jgi:hypothetical protein
VAQALVDRYGVAVSGAIHAPGREGDQRNHHAHLLFTTREMTPDGLGQKTRVLDSRASGPAEVAYLRAFCCDAINAALEEAGSQERVDHRSFAARGIDAEPSEHLGPSASAMERRGEASERGELNREMEARNRQREEDQAQQCAALDAPPAEAQAPPTPETVASVARSGLLERARRLVAGWFGGGSPAPPQDKPAVIPGSIHSAAAEPQAVQAAAESAPRPPGIASRSEPVGKEWFPRAGEGAQQLQPHGHETTEPTSTAERSRVAERFAALRDAMLSRIEARMRLTRRALAEEGELPVSVQREPERREGESAFERLQREAQARAEANMIREAREEARHPGVSWRRYQAWHAQFQAAEAAWEMQSQGRDRMPDEEPKP